MLRIMTAGESHGQCLIAVLDGVPADLFLDMDIINHELWRRQQGHGRGGRMGIEQDQVQILSGVRFKRTLGSPITLMIRNKDWENNQDIMSVWGKNGVDVVTRPRPGHADLTGALKYAHEDVRDVLERASARETAVRVAAGAIAKQLLQQFNMKIASHVVNIGGVAIRSTEYAYEEIVARRSVNLGCIEADTEQKMISLIDAAKKNHDTLGGIFEIISTKLIPGLGSYTSWEARIDAQLSAALMSIPAIKGVEFGKGFGFADTSGKNAHDEIYYKQNEGYYRVTNKAGGVEGGMTNGQPLIIRAVMKPIPSVGTSLTSVDIKTKQRQSAASHRSDVCAVSAAAVVGEAMVAITLMKALIEKFGGDTLQDMKKAVQEYLFRIKR